MTRREPGGRPHRPTEPNTPHPASGTPSPRHADPSTTVSFEDGLDHLGRIVDRLETGELGLADAIGAYEEGIALVRRLHGQLAECEQRVEMLAANAASPADTTPNVADTAGGMGDERWGGGQRPAHRPPAPPRPGRPRRLPGMDDPGHGV
jgi:exodeoxyribonuclease VII small subunit